MPLLDELGRSLIKGPGVKANIDRKLDEGGVVFEGVVQVKFFTDAIEGVGKCAHCGSQVEGVLRFAKGYSITETEDRVERQNDAKRQLYDKIKRDHQCGARIHKDKIDVDVFLRRFE